MLSGIPRSKPNAIIYDVPAPSGYTVRQVEELILFDTSMGGARPKALVEHKQDLRLAKFSRHDDRYKRSFPASFVF